MLRSPSTVQIRSARPTDARDLAVVFKDSWTLAYTGILPSDALAQLVSKREIGWWTQSLRSSDPVLVLEVGGVVAGYATTGRSRSRSKHQGEIYELYLGPVHQGLGFGEHLFEACRHRLDERGFKGLLVWALVDNTQACHFYWRRGGRPIASVMEVFGRTRLEKVAFGWP
jgi:ribosomal protein S18 acetylase RimI-like enzyme